MRASIKGNKISVDSDKKIYSIQSGGVFMTVLPSGSPGWSGEVNTHITISNGESRSTKVAECKIK